MGKLSSGRAASAVGVPMTVVRLAASGLAIGAGAGGASGQTFAGVVNSTASGVDLTLGASLTTSGTLIGNFDAATNPGGTQTRRGLFGGSGNNPIAASVVFGVSGGVASMPAGSVTVRVDVAGGSIGFEGLQLDVLNGSSGSLGLSATLEYESFNTISPRFIYPGGFPITLPLGEVASLTSAVLVQTGPGVGLLTGPDAAGVYGFALAVVCEATVEVSAGLLGGGGATMLGPVPVVLPVAGELTLGADGSLVLVASGLTAGEPVVLPVDVGALPEIPLSLPTLSAATADVVLTLTPSEVGLDAGFGVTLVVEGQRAVCPPDVTGDGVLDITDIIEFLLSYGRGDVAVADFAPAGRPDGVLNIFDILEFLSQFNGGCGDAD